ncbi:hypothetical protein [Lichenicoccus sp.]|uniref:hypothetical protein n=1 Tax=Lichenicoccus sp. TaxID=2781899 RepID=UPI003D0BCE0D
MLDRRLTRAPLRLVIFDGDGVLIDSEPPANRLGAAEIRACGYSLTDVAMRQRFAGKALGMIAARAAGMACIVLRPDGDLVVPALSDAPGQIVHRIRHLDELAPLLMHAPHGTHVS